jgi:hypothetical protein
VRVLFDRAESLLGNGIGELLGLFPDEGGTPGVGPEAAEEIGRGADDLFVALLFLAYAVERVVGDRVELGQG